LIDLFLLKRKDLKKGLFSHKKSFVAQ